jgi:hypothetical protein
MSGGEDRGIRIWRRVSPAKLLVLLFVIVVLNVGLAVILPWWRRRQFVKDVESFSGTVHVTSPEWRENGFLSRFEPLFERVVYASGGAADVDDRFLIRAAAAGPLEGLYVRGPGITDAGVASLKNEQSMRAISLYGTSVGNDSIVLLAQLPELESLYVSSVGSTFSDAAFEGLGECRSLTELRMGPVSLSERGAAGLAQATSLEHLRIVEGRVEAGAFRHLGQMTGLRTLSLDADVDPSTNPLPLLRRLTQLQTLTLHTPAIDDLAARDLCRYGQLRTLNLAATSVGDETLRRLAETEFPRTRLMHVNLSSTQVTDACLYDLAQFSRLRMVDVRGTAFSEPAAAELCRLQPRVTVKYTDSSGREREMTWDRLVADTGGTMQWSPQAD